MLSYLFDLIQYYGVILFCAIFLLVFMYFSRSLSSNITRYFIISTILVILLVFFDSVNAYCATLPKATFTRIFVAAGAYSTRVAIIFTILLLYLRKNSVKMQLFLSIPLIATIIAAYSAFWTPLSFYYSADNQIHRGPIIIIPFIASTIYFIYLLIFAIKHMKVGDNRETIILSTVLIFVIFATFLEVKYAYKGLLPGVSMFGILFYYIFFQTENITRDRLTKTYLRERLYTDTEKWPKNYGLIIIDVNNLKLINDQFGHIAGDQALIVTTNTIKNCLPNAARLYRLGGDEFLIVYREKKEEFIKILRDKIQFAMSKTPYSIAMGYVMIQPDETIEKAMSRADVLMYQNKRIQKGL